MRYKGRVKVAKVDSKGNKIRGKLKDWIKKHPNALYFDSIPEWECWEYMRTNKVRNTYQPGLTLYAGLKTWEFKKGEIINYSQRAIKYTPDFHLPKYNVYIEVKGYADELFKLRWKLFKLNGYDGYIVYSLAELKLLLKALKNDKKQ